MQHERNSGPAPSGYVDRYLPAQDGGSYDAAPATSLFNMSMIRAIAWRQKYVLIGVIGTALLIGLLYALLARPSYDASAKIKVETSGGFILEGQELSDPSIGSRQMTNYMNVQSEVIKSRRLALKVVDSLRLQNSVELLGEAATLAPPPGVTADSHSLRMRELAANIIRDSVSTDAPPTSQSIAITFSSSDRNLAARLANAYAETFLIDDIEQSIEANAYARDFLEEQIADVEERLRLAETAAIGYARNNRIIGQPMGGAGVGAPAPAGAGAAPTGIAPTLTAANLMQINQSYIEARAQRIAAEQRWQAVQRLAAGQLPEVQQSPVVQAQRNRLSELNGQLADMRERYREDYPALRELISEVATLEVQIEATSAEIRDGIRNQFEVARRQEEGLRAELALQSTASLDEQDSRVQFNLIDRDAQSLRSQLDALMERYNQLLAASNLRSSRFSMLDPAVVPGRPTSPNLINSLLLALVLGIGLAGVIALLRETFDDRLRSMDDVERKLGMAALGQTPFITGEPGDALEDQFSPLSEAYASIRASLDYRLGTNGSKVIQFTSSQSAEGKTTSSAAIATKYAEVGRRVLLIDMDLRRPSLSKMFGKTRSGSGVVDVLYGRTPLENALIKGDNPKLDVLPVGEIPANPVEILSSGLVAEFLASIRDKYDMVIIDSSPVMGIADAPLLSRFVDAVVMVVEANRAHARESRASIRRLQEMDANVLGTLVTKYRALEDGQSYNYQYRYYTYES